MTPSERRVLVPDLIDFQFGTMRGPVEDAAVHQVARALGAARPGPAGDESGERWREQAAGVVRQVLEGPEAGTGGTVRSAIEHERLVAWAASAGPARARLVDDLLDDLAHPSAGEPPSVSTDAVDQMLAGMQPLCWLVEAAARGVALEGAEPPHHLLQALAARAGWPAGRRALRAGLADNVPRVVVWVASQSDLVEPHGDSLVATPLGRSLTLDTTQLWRHVCRRTLAVPHPTVAMVELGLALLLREGPAPAGDLRRTLLTMARQEGLAIGVAVEDGRLRRDALGDPVTGPLDDRAAATWVDGSVRLTTSLATALGMLAPARGRRPVVGLTVAGRLTALALLRGRATAARRPPELTGKGAGGP